MTWQTPEKRITDFCQDGWFPGADGNPVSENFCIRYGRKHLYGEISHSHRTPSGNKDHVRLLDGGLTHVSKGVEIIVYDTHPNWQATGLSYLT